MDKRNDFHHQQLEARKLDHLQWAGLARTSTLEKNNDVFYEPLFGHLPFNQQNFSFESHAQCLQSTFMGRNFKAPFWISSMTGGHQKAALINQHLARAAKEFGLGFALGSCRPLLSPELASKHREQFHCRPLLGDDRLFLANLGISQIDQLLQSGSLNQLKDLLEKLQADGLIIHLNPLQEYFQPQGDVLSDSPFNLIQKLLSQVTFPVVVKEVGQGIGPRSLAALMQLPLAAVEFGAFGGTNFSKLEWMRSQSVEAEKKDSALPPLVHVGHSAEEMVQFITDIFAQRGQEVKCRRFIISGGIQHYLQAYILRQRLLAAAKVHHVPEVEVLVGMASAFLPAATHSYEAVQKLIREQISGLCVCHKVLSLNSELKE